MAAHHTLKMQAIAVDDEPLALKVIENFCGRVDSVLLQKAFTKPREALDYLQNFPIDLVFLDIQMPGLTGLDFRKLLQPETIVIFTTAYSEFALEGFNVRAMDYLLKPFTFDRFQQAVERAGEFFSLSRQAPMSQQQFIFLRADYNLHKISLADILLIEGFDDYLKIHLENQKSLVVRMTMKAILDKLPVADFIRVHRSFIVPIARIGYVRNKTVSVAGREVPLGGTYEKAFMDLMGGV
jgi:DNA-binding LytR/AlgR family response regulator